MTSEREYQQAIESQDRYMQLLDKQAQELQLKNQTLSNNAMQSSSYNSAKDNNLIELQLNCDKVLEYIYHTLSGHVFGMDEKENQGWVIPKDDRLIIFSEYGVRTLMSFLPLYITPHQLLSCYNPEQINWKMYDFGIKLADLIFFKYEAMFYYPTPEELYNKHLATVQKDGNEEYISKLYEMCVRWSNDELKSRIKHYPMLHQSIMDIVHAVYLRALNGNELDSLRKYVHISHNANSQMPSQMNQPTKFNVVKPSTW